MNRSALTIVAVLAWIDSFVLLVPYQIGLPKAATMVAVLLIMDMPDWVLEMTWIYTILGYSYYVSVAIVLVLAGTAILSAQRRRRAALLVVPITLLVIVASFVAGYANTPHR